jgi:hypothetical protein
MLLNHLKIIYSSLSMTEEIIYEDKRYKFYEDKIYGKTRFQYLKIYLAGRGNGRGKFITQRRYWSFITKGNNDIRQIDYPITMERIQKVYLC